MGSREKRGVTFTLKEAIAMIHDDGKFKLFNIGPLTALYFIIFIIVITVNIFKIGYRGNLASACMIWLYMISIVYNVHVGGTPVTKVGEGVIMYRGVW